VLRTPERTRTPARYLELAAGVMLIGKHLGIVDADGNLRTILSAQGRLG
jgi:hypothetical protein